MLEMEKLKNHEEKIILSALALAFLVAAGRGVNKSAESKTNLSELELANPEALAHSENNLCPNGCMDNGSGCYCNGWYPYYREA